MKPKSTIFLKNIFKYGYCFVLIATILLSKQLRAQDIQPLSPSMHVGSMLLDSISRGLVIRDTIQNYYYNSVSMGLLDDVYVDESALTISLFKNPRLLAMYDKPFQSKVHIAVNYRLINDPATLVTKKLILDIENNLTAGTHPKTKDQYIIKNVVWADISIDSLECTGIIHEELIYDLFFLKAEILGNQVKTMPSTADAPSAINTLISDNGGYIKVLWNSLPWAESYDLEYTFVDIYQPASGTPLKIPYNFRNNATRVSLNKTSYEIPLIFEQGMVVVRIRANGRLSDGSPASGKWSLAENGEVPVIETPTLVLEDRYIAYIRNTLAHESDLKNWQYIGSFSENGIRRDVVSYADGSLRTRQVVSKNNTNANYLMIGETFYDHQGRPAIAALPVPFKPDPLAEKISDLKGEYTIINRPILIDFTITPTDFAYTFSQPLYPNESNPQLTLSDFVPPGTGGIDGLPTISSSTAAWVLPESINPFIAGLDLDLNPGLPEWNTYYSYTTENPAIRYHPNFNVNEAGNAYSRKDFDIATPLTADCSFTKTAAPFGTSSGAGQYYSDNNPTIAIYRDLIPDAKGYPFTQTEYTGDASGRINRISEPGEMMQFGTGHEKIFYYSTPTQAELDKILGNDAGESRFYKKTITQDQNGQLILDYTDRNGARIASALAGVAPDNLIAIENDNISQQVDITDENMRLEDEGRIKISTRSVTITQPNSQLSLQYAITPSQFSTIICDGTNICENCVYDLNIQVTSDCGVLWNVNKRIGTIDDIIQCTSNAISAIDTTLIVDIGSYVITKSLSANAENIEKYVTAYAATVQSCIEEPIRDKFEPINCVEDECIPCSFDFIDNYYKRTVGNNAACERACLNEDGTGVFDKFVYEAMLRDLRPGGQYGEIFKTGEDGNRHVSVREFPVSIFNCDNEFHIIDGGLSRNYKTPVFDYLNPDGTLALIDVSSLTPGSYIASRVVIIEGRRFVKPKDILDLELLSEIWVDSWTESLIPFHPEYKYYLWNRNNRESFVYDSLLLDVKTFDEANENGFIKLEGGPINDAFLATDPFFNTVERRNEMRERLNNISYGDETININQLVRSAIRCNSPYYFHAENLDEWKSCMGEGKFNDFSEEEKQFAWEMFRSVYLANKAIVVDMFRTSAIEAISVNNCIGFDTYGCPGCPDSREKELYKTKSRLFQHPDCLDETFPVVDRDGDGTISEAERSLTDLSAIREWGIMSLDQFCNVDTTAQDWMYFISAMAFNKKLLGTSQIPSIPPIVLTSAMASTLPIPELPFYYWEGTPIGDQLQIRILSNDGITEKAKFNLHKSSSEISWNEISFCTCIQCDGDQFYIKAYTMDRRELMLVVNSTVNINFGACNNNNQPEFQIENGICCPPIFPPGQPANPCNDRNVLITKANEDRAIEDRMAFIIDSIRTELVNHCMSAAENLIVSWEEPIYQYTLYYYDLNGNLIQTIPPNGVQTITNTAQLNAVENYRNGISTTPIYPSHNSSEDNPESMATTYKFNSLNQKIFRNTPDGGSQIWRYDEVGRVILTQNEVQSATGSYTYLKYDEHGRKTETGTLSGGGIGTGTSFEEIYTNSGIIPYGNLTRRLTSGIRSEVFSTCFDKVCVEEVQTLFKAGGQKNLRNRAASILYNQDGLGAYDNAIHLSYDMSGNVTEFMQDFAALSDLMSGVPSSSLQEKKLTRYKYDLISGKIKEVAYQEGAPDQFYLWYTYDADEKVIAVHSGTNRYESDDVRENDIHYEYYLHGQMARAVIGQEKVQGIDFSYTIDGSLKNINSISLNDQNDPGNDGAVFTAHDAVGISLNYYDGDYTPIGRTISAPGDQELINASPDMFNGNIASIITRNDGIAELPVIGNALRYDQLNRITSSTTLFPDFSSAALSGEGSNIEAFSDDIGSELRNGLFNALYDINWGSPTENWKMDITYDRNSNIKTLKRKNFNGTGLDDLDYYYSSNTNQLDHITDSDGKIYSSGNIIDLGNQTNGNYTYDKTGRLLTDNVEGNAVLTWNAFDKLAAFSAHGKITEFYYNANGFRALKKVDENNGTLYIRDIHGNILSTYEFINGQVHWKDVPLYASSRFGTWNIDTILNYDASSEISGITHSIFRRGQKLYELSNQTGDVIALVSDRKLPVAVGETVSWSAEIVSSKDYYPFGMPMPGRVNEQDKNYAFSYQGMEVDNDLIGAGNSYSTEFRQYDPRVGRWLSLDPKEENYPSHTPYNAFLNNPTLYTDSRGDEVMSLTRYHREYERIEAEVRRTGGPLSEAGVLELTMQRMRLEHGNIVIRLHMESGQTQSAYVQQLAWFEENVLNNLEDIQSFAGDVLEFSLEGTRRQMNSRGAQIIADRVRQHVLHMQSRGASTLSSRRAGVAMEARQLRVLREGTEEILERTTQHQLLNRLSSAGRALVVLSILNDWAQGDGSGVAQTILGEIGEAGIERFASRYGLSIVSRTALGAGFDLGMMLVFPEGIGRDGECGGVPSSRDTGISCITYLQLRDEMHAALNAEVQRQAELRAPSTITMGRAHPR